MTAPTISHPRMSSVITNFVRATVQPGVPATVGQLNLIPGGMYLVCAAVDPGETYGVLRISNGTTMEELSSGGSTTNLAMDVPMSGPTVGSIIITNLGTAPFTACVRWMQFF